MAEPARKLPEEDRAVTRPDLRALEGGGEGDGVPQGDLKAAGSESGGEGLYNAGGDKSESSSEGNSESESPSDLQQSESNPDDSQSGGLYNPGIKKKAGLAKSLFKNRKGLAIGATGVIALISVILGIFLSLSSLSLPNFMANLEQKAFGRYQVDLNGRSSKWIESYMVLRFGEVDDPSKAPKDRNNIIFRADKVDNNKPLTDWYRTMRASKFEQDLFEKHGIKFTSFAYEEGNQIKFRAAKITINGDTIEMAKRNVIPFKDSLTDFDALSTGDINRLNGRLQDVVKIDEINNDKAARGEIKKVLKDAYPQWWRAVKRYHLRHDIQNMIGVRKWSLFENKRQALREDIRGKRNTIVQRVVDQSLPENTKSGKFIECLFGLTNCKSSSDIANKENRTAVPNGDSKGSNDVTNPDTNKTVTINDGSTAGTAQAASESAAAAGESLRAIIPKVFKTANVVSNLDTLAKFDKALSGHHLSKIVAQAKMEYVIGLYTTFKIADDQFKTGEMSSQDISDFQQQYGNLTHGEGWDAAIREKSSSGTVSAASTTYTEAKNKAEFCSEKHQTEMAKPENKQAAEKEYQWRCEGDKVGGTNNAKALEDAWISGPGKFLHPILSKFESTFGGVIDFVTNIFGSVVQGLVSPVLKVTGLDGTIKDVAEWGLAKAMTIAGANMDISSQTPSGRAGNLVIEGGGALAESTARYQGAALTTPDSRALATKNYVAYQNDKQKTDSLYERYFDTSNPQSLVASQIGSFKSLSFSNAFSQAFSSFGSLFRNSFSSLFASSKASTDDGYSVARFADVETYDLPKQCLDTPIEDMTPQNSTNADDLGYFRPDELNWEMMSNKETWYDALYKHIGNSDDASDKAVKVWNCALFDNTVRGGIGAIYGYKGEDAFGQ